MDDEEDYTALFFAECDELLGDLQEHLETLLAGQNTDDAEEAVNAAFRAVHSIKGGGAAFGFEALTSFAHQFESVMDLCRSGTLVPTESVVQVMLRASDAIELLVNAARESQDCDDPLIARVSAELAEFHDQPAPAAPPVEEVQTEPAPATTSELTEHSKISLIPHPDIFASGHDPLKILRDLGALGAVKATCVGTLPKLSDLDLMSCPLSWDIEIDTQEPRSAVLDRVSLYSEFADFERVSKEAILPEPVPEPPLRAEDPSVAPQSPPVSTQQRRAPTEQNARKSLRVEVQRIDRLVNLVGEIVITQSALAQRLEHLGSQTDDALSHAIEAMAHQTRELQEGVMAIRAQPVKSVFSRLPRIVRDLSDKLGKPARLELSGEHTEVDSTVIEELTEPLTHMLRNAMDHGLEPPDDRIAAGKDATGLITLSAEHRGERVLIKLSDDGRGIDRDRVLAKAQANGLVGESETLAPHEVDQLIFHPGFSTAQTVSDVSGRGVGMDVVKRKLQSLGGRCVLNNQPGKGTEFIITLPLTLAVLEGMVIVSNAARFILPLSAVIEALRIDDCSVEILPEGRKILFYRGEYLPLFDLSDCLGMPARDGSAGMAIILDSGTHGLFALQVDDLLGQRQVVLKSLEANYRQVEGVSGATILGDGSVALIIDIPALTALGTAAQITLHPKQEVA
ncbi:MAG: chemotaxis protein CheA [Pseudomonadota bacterium]